MRKRFLPWLAGITLLFGCQPEQPAERIPLELFFKNPRQINYRLSPEGTWLAYLDSYRGFNNLFIKRSIHEEGLRLTADTIRDIHRFMWANENLLLYLQDRQGDENFQLFGIDLNTRKRRCYTPYEGVQVSVLDRLEKDPHHILITLNLRDARAKDPYKLNLQTGELTMLYKNPGSVRRFLADHTGQIRIAYSDRYLYREDSTQPFREVLTIQSGDTFDPVAFASDNRHVYAYSSIGRDKVAIVEFDMASGQETRVMLEDMDYDLFGDDEIDQFVYSAHREGLVFALYTGERRELHFFDPELGSLYDRLQAEVGDYELLISSATDDYSKMILMARSDRTEGIYYLFDQSTDQLELISEASPWLPQEALAEMRSIQYQARDGQVIHGYLTLPKGVKAKNLPVIIHPHAGPQWRNAWGFDPRIQFFANRGYAVLQMNFRGSTGYGKAFMKAGFQQWGLQIQDDITDGVEYLIDEGIADPARVAIFGWSFGGYASLCGMVFTPELYACGIDWWGISNYFTLYNSYPPQWTAARKQINERWGNAEKDSIKMYQTSPVFFADQVQAPIFIAQNANDPRVRRSHSDQMAAELQKHNKPYEYHLLEGEGHALFNEKKIIDLMKKVEGFLERHL